MAVGLPFEEDQLRFWIAVVRRLALHREAADAVLFIGGAVGAANADVNVAVFQEVGVIGDPVDDALQEEDRLGLVGVAVVGHAEKLGGAVIAAVVFDDDEIVGSGQMLDHEAAGETSLWERRVSYDTAAVGWACRRSWSWSTECAVRFHRVSQPAGSGCFSAGRGWGWRCCGGVKHQASAAKPREHKRYRKRMGVTHDVGRA